MNISSLLAQASPLYSLYPSIRSHFHNPFHHNYRSSSRTLLDRRTPLTRPSLAPPTI